MIFLTFLDGQILRRRCAYRFISPFPRCMWQDKSCSQKRRSFWWFWSNFSCCSTDPISLAVTLSWRDERQIWIQEGEEDKFCISLFRKNFSLSSIQILATTVCHTSVPYRQFYQFRLDVKISIDTLVRDMKSDEWDTSSVLQCWCNSVSRWKCY